MDSFEDESYPLNGRKLCYIINNESFDRCLGVSERTGTNKDFEKLKNLFIKLDFKVENHKNCTSQEMRDNLYKISKRNDLDQYCMFVCIILSHGDEGFVYGTDNVVSLDDLVGLFKGDKCQKLIGKPKLFFIQACRGDKFDKGAWSDSNPSNNLSKIPIEADILIGYSTVPGYFSWRRCTAGSWYIQSLCHEIENNYKMNDLLDILVRVNNCVATNFRSNTGETQSHGMLQIPSFVCMLRKKLWFVSDHK